MNILLVCAAGMSTSLLVNRMKESAAKQGIECHIEAHPVAELTKYVNSVDCVLLGPQVRYELKKQQKKYPNMPMSVIDMKDYGMMNGEKVLAAAIKLANSK